MNVTSDIRTVSNDYSGYTPLKSREDEIRLLKVLPSLAKSSRLSCALIRTTLHDCPPFVALSYCWGSLDDTEQITLYLDQPSRLDSSWSLLDVTAWLRSLQISTVAESKSPPSPVQPSSSASNPLPAPIRIDDFNITVNLHAALRSFLLEDQPTFLWADMLCINQGDPAERSEQVRIMPRIYSRATSVLVWLGGDPNTDAGLLRDDDALLVDFFRDLVARAPAPRQIFNWYVLIHEFLGEVQPESAVENAEDEVSFGLRLLMAIRDHILQVESPPPPPQGVSRKAFMLSDFAIYYFILWIRSKLILRLIPEVVPEGIERMFIGDAGQYIREHQEALVSVTRAMLVPGSSVWGYIRTAILLHFNRYLDLTMDGNFEESRTLDTGGSDDEAREWESNLPCVESDFLRRISEIASSAWFTRMWVLQEVAHGQDVIIRHGGKAVDWSSVMALSLAHTNIHNNVRGTTTRFSEELITRMLKYVGKPLPPIWSHADRFLGRGIKGLDIYQILRQSAPLQSTDPRDKLFALYHLAEGLDASKFEPDYTQDVSGVFVRFTKWLIDQDKTLRVLSFTGNSDKKRLLSLPSWAPDYRLIEHLKPRSLGIDYDSQADGLGGQDKAALFYYRPSLKSNQLALRGTHVTSILQTFNRKARTGSPGTDPVPWHYIGIPATWGVMNDIYKQCFLDAPSRSLTASDTKHGEEKFSLKIFFETLMLLYPIGDPAEPVVRMWQEVDPTFRLIEEGALWRDKLRMKSWREEARQQLYTKFTIQAAVWYLVLEGRGMFFSEEGEFGLCPETAEQGDQIVALDGGKCLYVVRRRFDGGSWRDAMLAPPTWEFVGECYLRGHMNGEVPGDARLRDPLVADPWERMRKDNEWEEALAVHPGRRMVFNLE